VYLQGVPTDVTKEQLQELFSGQYGRVANVQIIGVKGHVTKCAFVNFACEASAQKVGGFGGLGLVVLAAWLPA
jgi:RNA recognition motif-containing protein